MTSFVCCTRVALAVELTFAACQAYAVTIDTVPVDNPGNPADTRYDAAGFGSVGYTYRIGKYEVTNAQYVEFLNGVDPIGANALELYNVFMSSDARGGIIFNGGAANGSKYEIKLGRDNNPVVFVSWYDSIRFANWMHNGQASGDTENGAYTLLGGTTTPSNGSSITRNPGARWFLPSEDEWYKAAFHKNDGATGNYWDFPTSTDAEPYSDDPSSLETPDNTNMANYYNNDLAANSYNDGYALTGSTTFVNGQNYLTNVGDYSLSISPYGVFDQGGSVWEWNEAIIGGSFRGRRGGGWSNNTAFGGSDHSDALHAASRHNFNPSLDTVMAGFRVASIPEPSTLLLLCLGSLAVLWRRRSLR